MFWGVVILANAPGRGQEAKTISRAISGFGERWAANGKLGRNVDRYGTTQAAGLLRDGFPYVGILHTIVADTGPPSQWTRLERLLVRTTRGASRRYQRSAQRPLNAQNQTYYIAPV